MKFSIVVPVYNTEKYVGECIESALVQTDGDFELLLVNDGSTDRSGAICQQYCQKDSRVRYFQKENSGQLSTRLFGVSHAKGEYVLFLDSDDLLAPWALEVLREKLDACSCDMVVYVGKRFCGQPPVEDKKIYTEQKFFDNKKKLNLEILSSEVYNSLCTKAFRRQLIRPQSYDWLEDVRYGEDLLQLLDILSQNPKTLMIRDELYYYRTNPKSLTHSLRTEQYALDIVRVRAHVWQYLLKEERLNEEEWFQYKGHAIRILTSGISNILHVRCPLSQKVALLRKIQETSYYKEFLAVGKYNKTVLGNKRVLWFLFKRSFYRMMWIMVACKAGIRKLFRS